ncbi:1,3-beta-glucan synthase subunit FKS1, domain-1 family protein [Clavispora lusitaniae]|uniref:1,3-beta-glucan synthase subunit FKS1, domain-1 family protein n=1 Tax=Clavispora lusitaniae TaxID=36911 RepID=UPI00202BD22B|nr:1,3-beta-glucan synthase subunit FKS1, domain-1 family protein [Clavispora lusitaniae]
MTMLDSRASRLGPVNALKSIHGDYIGGINSNFRKWFFATEMDTQAGNSSGSLCSSLAASRNSWKAYIQNLTYSGMISHVGLYLLCWGEANNIRFMPECICFIFKCCVDLLEAHEDYLHMQNDPRSFLDEVITPIYEALRNQCYPQKNDISFTSRKDHEYIIGYDDMNQMFWSKGGIERIILKDKTKLMSQPMEKRALHLSYTSPWVRLLVLS